MESKNDLMMEFQRQLRIGKIQKAYSYIHELFSGLGKAIEKQQGGMLRVGSLYHGYLDMTYIPVVSHVLKENGLKVAIVFDYEKFEFEIWLSGVNKGHQKNIWGLLKEKKWKKHDVLESLNGEDAIVKTSVKEICDFSDFERIVCTLTSRATHFIFDVEEFLRTGK